MLEQESVFLMFLEYFVCDGMFIPQFFYLLYK